MRRSRARGDANIRRIDPSVPRDRPRGGNNGLRCVRGPKRLLDRWVRPPDLRRHRTTSRGRIFNGPRCTRTGIRPLSNRGRGRNKRGSLQNGGRDWRDRRRDYRGNGLAALPQHSGSRFGKKCAPRFEGAVDDPIQYRGRRRRIGRSCPGSSRALPHFADDDLRLSRRHLGSQNCESRRGAQVATYPAPTPAANPTGICRAGAGHQEQRSDEPKAARHRLRLPPEVPSQRVIVCGESVARVPRNGEKRVEEARRRQSPGMGAARTAEGSEAGRPAKTTIASHRQCGSCGPLLPTPVRDRKYRGIAIVLNGGAVERGKRGWCPRRSRGTRRRPRSSIDGVSARLVARLRVARS